MKVGFIGLGTMGARMATNLQTYLNKSNHGLVVFDLNRQSAEPHLANGATWADSPRAVAEQCDVIFASLPGPPEVESVALGPDGLIGAMKKGATFFDLATNSPTVVRKIEAAFAAKGLHMMDAPCQRWADGRARRQACDLGRRRQIRLRRAQGLARRHR